MTMLVVGLGNPGPEYARTRHNAGFMAVDLLAENLRVTYWKDQAGAKVAHTRFGDEDLVLAKPQTFMNISGKAVRKLADENGLEPSEIVIVHDDIDLPEGSVHVKRGGGHGGHNGLRSVNEQLGNGDYTRVRVGVGRPPGRKDAADFVLEQVRGEAAERLDEMIPTAAQAVLHVLEHGAESAMREYNAD